jgi:hypothetical protein
MGPDAVAAAELAGAAGAFDAAGSVGTGLLASEPLLPVAFASDAGLSSMSGGLGGLSKLLPSPETLALQGLSTALSSGAQTGAMQNQRRLLDAMKTLNDSNLAKRRSLAQGYVDQNLSTKSQREALDVAEASNKAGYEDALAATASQPLNISGKVSDDFKSAEAKSAKQVADRNADRIRSLSAINAPGVADAARASRYGRATSDMASLGRTNDAIFSAGQSDLSAQVPDAGMQAAGEVFGGLSTGLAALRGSAAKQAREKAAFDRGMKGVG